MRQMYQLVKNKTPASAAGVDRLLPFRQKLFYGAAGDGANVSAGNTEVCKVPVSHAAKFGDSVTV